MALASDSFLHNNHHKRPIIGKHSNQKQNDDSDESQHKRHRGEPSLSSQSSNNDAVDAANDKNQHQSARNYEDKNNSMMVSATPHIANMFEIQRSLEPLYTGGQICLMKLIERRSNFIDSTDENNSKTCPIDQKTTLLMLAWCQGNINIIVLDKLLTDRQDNPNASSFVIRATIEAEEDDGFSTFAVDEGRQMIYAATARSHQLRSYDVNGRLLGSFRIGLMALEMVARNDVLATTHADRSVRVWSIEGRYLTHNLKGHSGLVERLWFPPSTQFNENVLLSASHDGEIRVWQLRASPDETTKSNYTCRILSNHMSLATAVDFSIENELMVSVGRDKIATLWSLKTWSVFKTILVHEVLEGVCFCEQAGISGFSTVGEKGIIRFFNISGIQLSQIELSGVSSFVDSKTAAGRASGLLHSDATRIVVTAEQNLILLDENLQQRQMIVGYNDEIVDIKTFSSDDCHSQRIAVATNSAQVRIFDAHTFDVTVLSGHKDVVLSVDISADAQFLVTSSKDNTVRFWLASTGGCIAVCDGHAEAVTSVSFCHSKNAKAPFFAASGGRDRTLKLWDCSQLHAFHSGAICTVPAMQSRIAHTKEINCVAISPNDKFVVSGSMDRSIKVWQSADLSQVASLNGHKRGVWCLEFSEIDRVLASGSGDRTIKIWSMVDFTCLKTFEGHTSSVLQVRFFNAGTQLVSSGSDGLIKIWGIKSNECVATLDQHTGKIWGLAMLRDDHEISFVSGGADSKLHIWNDVTERERALFVRESQVRLRKEQAFQNLVRAKHYGAALTLALDLKQPRRLFSMFSELCTAPIVDTINTNAQYEAAKIAKENEQTLTDVLGNIELEKFDVLADWVKEWNSNATSCAVANKVLRIIIQTFSPQSLLRCTSLRNSLLSISAYNERHFARLDKLLQRSFLIDYTLQAMHALQPAKL